MSYFMEVFKSANVHVTVCSSLRQNLNSCDMLTVIKLQEKPIIYKMLKTVSAEGNTVIDNTVKIDAAGGNGFTHKCHLPKIKATWR